MSLRSPQDCGGTTYAEHVLLHRLIVPLLDLIQSPYHGVIVTFVAKCLLHVHQQVPHRDVFAFVQHAGPFAWVPMETGKDMGAHTSLIILLEEGIYIEAPERVRHLCPWISRLKDQHIQSFGCQLCGLCAYASGLQSHSQWSIHQSLILPCLGKKGANPLC